jgi:hypothetical protein
VITRDLLEQVTQFPHLSEEQSRLLKTIASLGPEKALRDQTYYWDGRHEARAKNTAARPPRLLKKQSLTRKELTMDRELQQ